jgi:hypothetical protein
MMLCWTLGLLVVLPIQQATADFPDSLPSGT